MKNRLRRIVFAASCVLALFPSLALAHQPRLVTGGLVEIQNPEVSQAFYSDLKGAPAEFRIQADRDFRLYVGLLVPDIPGARKDISAEITRVTASGSQGVALLDGRESAWTPFYEEYAKDNYFWGPEFKAVDSQKGEALKGRTLPAGTYVIKVFSPENLGKYSLVVGDLEEFPPREILNAAVTLPRLKAQFFGYSPLAILASPFGWGYLLALYIIAFAVGLISRALVRRFTKQEPFMRPGSIGLTHRLIRAGLGLALLVWAITTSWNPLLVFLSGFCVFAAVFGWCGLCAALGKDARPVS